jgi:hypothetical protein
VLRWVSAECARGAGLSRALDSRLFRVEAVDNGWLAALGRSPSAPVARGSVTSSGSHASNGGGSWQCFSCSVCHMITHAADRESGVFALALFCLAAPEYR